jgi:hypothetical protein
MRATHFASGLASLSLLLGATCEPIAPQQSAGARFVLEAPRGPVYVQVATLEDQPGWIRVSHSDGQRVHLRPPCEIPECGKPPVVCGAAVPLVRDIATAGRVEFTWDGMESIVDDAARCATRKPAAAGQYVATFCYSSQADIVGGGNPATGVQGSLVKPVCTDIPFSWPKDSVTTFRIP